MVEETAPDEYEVEGSGSSRKSMCRCIGRLYGSTEMPECVVEV
jgi:hypothetical protein